METTILKATYRRISGKTERQHLYITDTDMGQEGKIKRAHQIIQNDLEFADDAQLFIEKIHTNKCSKGSETTTYQQKQDTSQYNGTKLSCYDEKDAN